MTVGDRYTLIVISLLKKALLTCPTDAGERLEILEALNSCAGDRINHFVLSHIQPMCDTGYRMVEASCQLDPPEENPYPQHDSHALNRTQPGRASFTMLVADPVFSHLRRLNPSIDEALRLAFPAALSRTTGVAE